MSYLVKDNLPSSLSHWKSVERSCVRDELLEDGSGKTVFAHGFVEWPEYSPEDNDRFSRLLDRQKPFWEKWACEDHRVGYRSLFANKGIPPIAELEKAVWDSSRFKLVGVNGLLAAPSFFELLAHRMFPVTWWMRSEHEMDYIVEPDLFHDVAGHLPMLCQPAIADFMHTFGLAGLQLLGNEEAIKRLGSLYWFTFEFGLVSENEVPRIWGGGILSSVKEMSWSIEEPSVERCLTDSAAEIMAQSYRIDELQKKYFVLPSFDSLSWKVEDLVRWASQTEDKC